MVSKHEVDEAVITTLSYFEKASIALTNEEKKRIEIADFGLNDLKQTGLQLIAFVNTDRVCTKEMVLFP